MVKKCLLSLLWSFFSLALACEALADEEFYIKSEIISQNLYPESEIVFQIKILDFTERLKGKLDNPVVVGDGYNTLIPHPNMSQKRVVMYGRNAILSTYTYSVFVTQKGNYEITPTFFIGTYKGRNIQLSTENLSFVVKSLPTKSPKNWRSAYNLELQSGFSAEHSNIKVGDVVRHTIVLKMVGADKNFFKPLLIPEVKNVKIYKSSVSQKNVISEGHLNLEQRYNYIYIPNKVGELIIPDYYFEWFDLSINQSQKVVVLGKKFNVLPLPESLDKGVDGVTLAFSLSWSDFWKIIISIIAVVIIFIIVAKYKKILVYKNLENKKILELKKACNNKNPKLALICSLELLRFLGYNLTNIKEVALLFDDAELYKQLERLNKACFNKNEKWKSWEGGLFFEALMKVIKNPQVQQKIKEFPPLYPFN